MLKLNLVDKHKQMFAKKYPKNAFDSAHANPVDELMGLHPLYFGGQRNLKRLCTIQPL
jgi:hypothetical protein